MKTLEVAIWLDTTQTNKMDIIPDGREGVASEWRKLKSISTGDCQRDWKELHDYMLHASRFWQNYTRLGLRWVGRAAIVTIRGVRLTTVALPSVEVVHDSIWEGLQMTVSWINDSSKYRYNWRHMRQDYLPVCFKC